MSQPEQQRTMTENGFRPAAGVRGWLRDQGAAYRNGSDRPLAGYLVLTSGYAAGTLGGSPLARRLGRRVPGRLGARGVFPPGPPPPRPPPARPQGSGARPVP